MGGEGGYPLERGSAAQRARVGADGTPLPQRDGESDPSFLGRIEAASAGSDEALGELLAQCRSYLLLVANREVEPNLQAKVAPSDLVQETLADALGEFKKFRGTTEAELRIWLARILKSRYSVAVARFQETQKRDISRELPLAGSAPGRRPAVELESPDETPRAAAITHENESLVQSAIGRLPAEYRRVIEMRNWQRLSFEEIGQQLERSAEAARKLWARATERLGLELESVDDSR